MTSRRRSLDDLPEDIWIDIIKTYITNYDDQSPHMIVDRLLPLILVSRNWDLRIRAIPTLWSDLVVNDEINDLEMKVATCLYFSQNALIRLFFIGYTKSWSYLSSRIISERSRISSIAIAGGDTFSSCGLDSILAEISPLPALKVLRCHPNSHFMLDIEQFESSPILSNMEGCFILPTELNQTPHTVQTLCADVEPGLFLPLLEPFDRIKNVSLFWPDSNVIHEYLTTIDEGDLSWRSFVCYWLGNQSHISLFNRLRLSLVNLTIALHVDEWLLELLHSLGGFIHLRYCEIDIRGENTSGKLGIVANNESIGPPCPATTLTFSLSVPDFEDENLEAVAAVLQASFPMIRELNISGTTGEGALYFLSGRGFQKVTTLSMPSPYYTTKPGSIQHTIDIPASLSSIVVENFPMDILSAFMTTGVEKVEHRGGSPEFKISQFNEWTGLRSLMIIGAPISTNWDGFSSHSLCRLIYERGQDSTDIFHHFATYPLSCPSLEYLEIRTISDWDIFFIMLERRNLTHRDAVSPLKYIVLPDLCPRYLRRPIRQLLRCKVPTRPSYYNLSRQRIWEEIQDPEIPGCITCLSALRFCKQAVDVTGFKIQHGKVSSEQVAYPSDPDEILSTRLSRQNQLPIVDGRKTSCAKPGLTPSLIDITEDSVEEFMCDWDEAELFQLLYPEDLLHSK